MISFIILLFVVIISCLLFIVKIQRDNIRLLRNDFSYEKDNVHNVSDEEDVEVLDL